MNYSDLLLWITSAAGCRRLIFMICMKQHVSDLYLSAFDPQKCLKPPTNYRSSTNLEIVDDVLYLPSHSHPNLCFQIGKDLNISYVTDVPHEGLSQVQPLWRNLTIWHSFWFIFSPGVLFSVPSRHQMFYRFPIAVSLWPVSTMWIINVGALTEYLNF